VIPDRPTEAIAGSPRIAKLRGPRDGTILGSVAVWRGFDGARSPARLGCTREAPMVLVWILACPVPCSIRS